MSIEDDIAIRIPSGIFHVGKDRSTGAVGLIEAVIQIVFIVAVDHGDVYKRQLDGERAPETTEVSLLNLHSAVQIVIPQSKASSAVLTPSGEENHEG